MLGQGRVIDALRLAKNSLGLEKVPARKFLEAAHKTQDDLIFYSVYRFFQMRNLRMYETLGFPKGKSDISVNSRTLLNSPLFLPTILTSRTVHRVYTAL